MGVSLGCKSVQIDEILHALLNSHGGEMNQSITDLASDAVERFLIEEMGVEGYHSACKRVNKRLRGRPDRIKSKRVQELLEEQPRAA